MEKVVDLIDNDSLITVSNTDGFLDVFSVLQFLMVLMFVFLVIDFD